MDAIENAQHDLTEAKLSVETAIELLASLERDGSEHAQELRQIVQELQEVKSGLDSACERLHPLTPEND
jgi:gamma-glutamyl:cysteine ligase YbdK (ATP-grasp superfamily)